MMLPETLATPRLLLRKPLIEDAPAILQAYAQDAEVTRYLTWRPHRSIEDTLELLLARLACWENGTEFAWVLTTPGAPGDVLGMIAAIPERSPWRCMLGYVLARPHWGCGYMTEAVRAVVALLLAQPGVRRVWAVVDVENFASARVLEKAGLTREGILSRWGMAPNLSDAPRDCWAFATVR